MTKYNDHQLQEVLSASESFSDYIVKHQSEFSKKKIHMELQRTFGLKSISKKDLISITGLNKAFVYDVFSGRKHPSRNTVIKLLIGMECSLNEYQTMLKLAGYAPLFVRDFRDAIIMYGITHRFSFVKINCLLDQHHCELL